MQSYTIGLAVCLLWLHGAFLFHSANTNTRFAAFQVLLPLCTFELDLLLLHPVRRFCVGQHRVLGQYQGARVLALQCGLRERLRSQNSLDHSRFDSCSQLDCCFRYFLGNLIFRYALHVLEHYIEGSFKNNRGLLR